MTARDMPSTQVVRLLVNGAPREVVGAASRRLSDVLRDELGLIGTKIGCHAGDCGACTVLLDSAQVCSCIVALGSCEGRAVTTVEGLADASGALSPLQQAFVQHGAAQCGICTPGMLMAAEALLRVNAAPSETEVCDALAGVLCRCTGYRKIVEAVLAVARGDRLERVEPRAGAAVGARVARLDAQAKVAGLERFGADAARAGTLTLRVIRSPFSSATFTLGDLAAFLATHPGVFDVITAADVPNNAFAIFPDLRDQPVLADGVARFRGEAVIALVGDADALAAISDAELPITYTPCDAVTDVAAALAAARNGHPIHARYPDNVLCRGRVVRGDVDAALAASAHAAETAFVTRHVEHAYIEPEAGYAEVVESAGVRRVRVFACTQTPYMDRDELAHVLGVETSQVHIVPSAIGGGFGGKLDLSVQPLLAVAAWKLGRAVRVVYERPESMRSSTKRHPARMSARAACDAEGRLTAFDFEGDFDTGAYSSWGPTVANRVPIHASGPYRIANVRALTRAVHTHNPVAGAFRGFGVPQSTLINELLIDELAAASGIDALEFRFRNALVAGDATSTGQVLAASVGLQACLDVLRPAWTAANDAARAFNANTAGPLRRGAGIACMWYGIGNTVIANPSTMRGSLRCDATRGAYLHLDNGAQEIGQGSATVMPQMFADAVGLAMAGLVQTMGDTDLTADAGKSSASRQTFVSGRAVQAAGAALRTQMLASLGFDGADASGDAVALHLDGTRLVGTRQGERRVVDLRTLPLDAHGAAFTAIGTFNPPTIALDADGQGVPYATYGFAAQIAEVAVDVELGTVTLLHIHAAHDVGRAINPTQVEGQVHGGIAQGIGMALMEEYVNGQTDNLHDYLIPTVGDVPPITVHLIEDPEPLGPWGAKGVGEPALVATAPAILNAIHAATGVRMREVPVTPTRLCAAIRAVAAAAVGDAPEPLIVEPAAAATKTPSDKIRCDACPVLCLISPGKLGACDRYGNVDGRLQRTDVLQLIRKPGAALVEWPAARDGAWDGKVVADLPVFVTGNGSTTTYPDYKPAPFIIASQHHGVDLVTVVTEGIFSYCSFKVKVDTDRYLGPEQATVRHKGEAVGHVTTIEYGAQFLALGGVHHLTGGSKRQGRVACDMMMALGNQQAVELEIEGGARLTVQAGKAPIVNGVTEERMRVGCGSATIGIFAPQWVGHVDEVVVIDDHITGVLSEHQAGKFLDMAPTGIRMHGRRSTPGRYFQVANPGAGWGGTDIVDPLSIIESWEASRGARPGLRLLMVSTTGEDAAWFVLDDALVPQPAPMPEAVQRVVEHIGENCEPSLCSVLYVAGAGGSLRAGVTDNPIRLTEAIKRALVDVTCGGAPVYVWPGGGITVMVDVARMPAMSFGSVPTPAIVSPIEFTMTLADYRALGGHMGSVRRLEEVLAGGAYRLVDGDHGDHGNPWPIDVVTTLKAAP